MRVIFSFDDGRADSINASRILAKHSLVGTFHITTGFVDGSFQTNTFGVGREPLTIEQLIELKKEGMEISSHGDNHIMETEDFNNSFKKLKNWGLIKNDKVGFSIPNSRYTKEALDSFLKENEKTLYYVRGGRSPKCYSFISKVNYLL